MKLADGSELWTTSSGAGPDLVLLHGGPGLWDHLAPLAALLGPYARCHRFDQRGCGRSSGGGPFTIEQAVADLDAVRAALGVERWWVLGHSWGAELALRYAVRHPSRVVGVFYVNGVGAGDGFREVYAAELRSRLGASWERFEELRGRARTLEEEKELCLLRWAPDFSPSWDGEAGALALWDSKPPGAAVNVEANQQLWADRATSDLLVEAAGCEVPVTIVFGRDDPRPLSATDPLLAALPVARRVVIEGAGHAPWVERPADFVEVVAGGQHLSLDREG